jgi:hypothetical protein
MTTPLPQRCIRYRPPRHGALWLDVDLRLAQYATLDFWDEAQSRVRLHVSIRRDEGVIVLNRHGPKGWHGEVTLAAPLGARLHRLALHFRPGPGAYGLACALSLDGARLARVDAVPRPSRRGRYGLQRGFAGLAQIGWVDLPLHARITAHMATGMRGVSLTDRMELTWSGPNPPRSVALPDGEVLTLEPVAEADRDGGYHRAVLPGRMWHSAGVTPAKLTLLGADGTPCGTMILDRMDLLARLERLAESGWVAHDMLSALQALEHAHMAAILPDASPTLRAALAQAAQTYRLGHVVALPETALHAGTVPTDRVADLVNVFMDQQAAQPVPQAMAALDSLLAKARLRPEEVWRLGLSLSEWACRDTDPLALHAVLNKAGWRPAEAHSVFAASASLPRYWAAQDWPAFRAALQVIQAAQSGWVVTPAMGWTLRALTHDLAGPKGHATLFHRTEAALGLLRTIRARAAGSGAQMRCTCLMGSVVDMIANLKRYPGYAQDTLAWLVLQGYGLAPEFWAAMNDLPSESWPTGWADWASLAQALNGAPVAKPDAYLHHALARFEIAEIAGADTYRRCLVPDGGLPDLQAGTPIALTPAATREAALRWLAFPRADRRAPPPALVQTLARDGIKAAATHIDRPANSQAMLALGRRCMTALATLRDGTIPDGLEDMRHDAASLLHDEAGFCGGAVLLAMAEGLAHAGGQAHAARYLDTLRLGVQTRDQAALRQAPALRHASARFADCCPDPDLRAQAAAILTPDPALRGPNTPLRQTANPLADTLVVVISCQPYLSTRIPAIRRAWGDLLDQAGLPMIVAVGGATGTARLENSVLHLPAPDDYEGLPQKILALADWAATQTGFSRILKIDDDCFLDPTAFFADLSALCAPYYGRPLRRAPGEMDRAWHMAKASSLRGRTEFDKSPEPAIYADGGAGYLLSRAALLALREARAAPEGRALEAVSFMEDKLIGDLLALRGITVSGTNYDMAIFRRSAPGLPPLPQYENGFLPFAGANVKVAHLDAGGDLDAARQGLASPWPNPMKVWPPHLPARLGWARNTLDLVSPVERLDKARKADVAVVAVMRNERFILDHFLAHYRGLGVGAFLVADNGSDDGTLEHLVAQPDVTVFTTDTPYNESIYGVLWQEALLANFRIGRWSLIADADEFLFWSLPDAQGQITGDLPELLRGPDFSGSDMVRLSMLDLYPSGSLSEATFSSSPFLDATHVDRTPLRHDYAGRGPWGNCASVTSNLRHRLMAGLGHPAPRNLFVAQKFALVRYHPKILFSAGLHYAVGGTVAAKELAFAHFKYSAAFHAKTRAEVARGQHFNNAEEYRKYLALLSEGRDSLFDPSASVPLAECPWVQALVAKA